MASPRICRTFPLIRYHSHSKIGWQRFGVKMVKGFSTYVGNKRLIRRDVRNECRAAAIACDIQRKTCYMWCARNSRDTAAKSISSFPHILSWGFSSLPMVLSKAVLIHTEQTSPSICTQDMPFSIRVATTFQLGTFYLWYLETPIVDSHFAADTKFNLERVHTDEIPHAKKGLIFVSGCNEPVVGVLCVTAYEFANKTVVRASRAKLMTQRDSPYYFVFRHHSVSCFS